MENVPRLRTSLARHLQDGNKIPLRDIGIEEDGFLPIPQIEIFNAAWFGVPQTRKRLFLGDFPIPEEAVRCEETRLSLRSVIEALPNAECAAVPESKVSDPLYPDIIMTEGRLTDHFNQNGALQDDELYQLKRVKQDHSWYGHMDVPDRVFEPARTLLARQSRVSREGIYVPSSAGSGVRRLTPREVACLMSFPITYQFWGSTNTIRMTQMGNAVCPLVAAAIGRKIITDAGHDVLPPHPLFPLRQEAPAAKTVLQYTPETKMVVKKNRAYRQHLPGLCIGYRRVDIENSFVKRKIRPNQPVPLPTAPFPSHPLMPQTAHLSGWQSVLHVGIGKYEYEAVDWKNAVRDLMLVTYMLDNIYPHVKGFLEEVAAAVPQITPDATTLQARYSRQIFTIGTHPDELLDQLSKIVMHWFPLGEIGKVQLSTHTIEIAGRRPKLRLAVFASLVIAAFACYCANRGTEWMATHTTDFYWPSENEGSGCKRPDAVLMSELKTCNREELLQEIEQTETRIKAGELNPVKDKQAVLCL
jgi:hypothetical protein